MPEYPLDNKVKMLESKQVPTTSSLDALFDNSGMGRLGGIGGLLGLRGAIPQMPSFRVSHSP